MQPCSKEAEIAKLEERTTNFSRRFDEVNSKIEDLKETIDKNNDKMDSLSATITQAMIDEATEKAENKWKHRMAVLGIGAGGGSGVFGLIKLIGHFVK